ncbi:hypothetical protein CFP56_031169 [Quercus suber]|uniref:Reverse transcriptase zinc-binding domain-containing protein n=1 Tax=Quercus suber TaxID=58331 RepID=A0AAW0JM86_QUESU
MLILKALPPKSMYKKRQRLFRFKAMWIKEEECDGVVKEAWERGRILGGQNQFGRLTLEIVAESENASCSDLANLHGVWRGVWSLNQPNRIKQFTWKACNGILATKDSLFRRKITANNICEDCGRHVETTMHLLYFCNRSTELTFKSIGVSWTPSVGFEFVGKRSKGCWSGGSRFVGAFGRAETRFGMEEKGGNVPAHLLAQHAQKVKSLVVWLEECPSQVAHACAKDVSLLQHIV